MPMHKTESGHHEMVDGILKEEEKKGWMPVSLSCTAPREAYGSPFCIILFKKSKKR